MRFIAACLMTGLLLAALPAHAQKTAQPGGMRHMNVTIEPAAPAATPGKNETVPAAPDAPPPKALTPEDALKKTEGLAEWPYYTDLMTVDNDTALLKVVHSVDIDPGAVPPKGLFYIAKALSDRKRYREAAFYFYAAQLRATFDMRRFPAYAPDKKPAPDKRTEDQKGRVPSAAPSLVNPHEEISVFALTIGSPIAKWAMADPARLDAVMKQVRDWDLATPYAYLPDYDISHAEPYENWAKLLTRTRNDYFTRVRQISRGLTALKPVEPAPSFSKP